MMKRAADYVTDPYHGTQGKGKEWARDIQKEKESKTYPIGPQSKAVKPNRVSKALS